MASSTTFSSLTDDILFEIFVYLPLASIYLLKSVSKLWLSNLSNHNFITKWFQINRKSLPWIQYHTITPHYHDFDSCRFRNAYPDSNSQLISRNYHGFSFDFLRNEKSIQGDKLFLLGSSNGLVLCVHPRKLNRGDRYHVCNPLTQKWVSLPSPPRLSASVSARKCGYNGIFCENSLSASCSYKVVSIPSFTSSNKFNVDMFDSEVGQWRRFKVWCDQDVFMGFDKNVITYDGVLYFLEGWDRMLVYKFNQNNRSVGHRCSLIKLPGPNFTWMEYDEFDCVIINGRAIGESEGRICYATTRVTGRKINVNVWMLDEDNWKILHKDILVLGTLTEICLGTYDFTSFRVSGFSPADRNVVLLGCVNRVWSYNIKTGSFEELGRSLLLTNKDRELMSIGSFVLNPMPTILPPPSWTDDFFRSPLKYVPLDMSDVYSIAQLFSSKEDLQPEEDLQEVVDDKDMIVFSIAQLFLSEENDERVTGLG